MTLPRAITIVLAAAVLGVGCNPPGRKSTTVPGATIAFGPASPASFSFTGDQATVAAKRAFVQETCTMMFDAGDPEGRQCAVVQDLGDWLVIRSSDAIADGMRWRWFVGALGDDGWFVLLASEDVDLPPYSDDPVDAVYQLCEDTTAGSAPPVDSGLVAVEIDNTTRDDRIELRLECNDTGQFGEHYTRTCPSGDHRCTAPEVLASERVPHGS